MVDAAARAIARRPWAMAAVALTLVPAATAAVHASARHGQRQGFFRISASLRGAVWPGATQPVDLALGNPTRRPLWVTSLRVSVSVDAAHRRAGCSLARDFDVSQLPWVAFPIMLPGRSRQARAPMLSLAALGVRFQPAVRMRDLAVVNQNGCKGASLRLLLSGHAARSLPRPR